MTAPRFAPASKTRCLVTGLTGQDGFYLARHLLKHDCEVIGAVRSDEGEQVAAIKQELKAETGREPETRVYDLDDAASIDALIGEVSPEVVYHLAAMSSVGLSWGDPVGTAQTNAMGTLHLLEALRGYCPGAAFVFAGSCDCFDHAAAGGGGVTPMSPFKATNPYAASKVFAHQMVRCYRAEFGLRASVAIFFNHTSPRRHTRFVECGIVHSACEVAAGRLDKVVVGSLETRRDWAWAEDLIEAFAAMGTLEKGHDLVLASGATHTTGDWVSESFAMLGLDPEHHVHVDETRCHPGDRPHTYGNIALTEEVLGWKPKTDFKQMVTRLVEAMK